jgi:hypothetical protein
MLNMKKMLYRWKILQQEHAEVSLIIEMASLVFIKGIATSDCAITVDVECTDKAQWAFGRKILCARVVT